MIETTDLRQPPVPADPDSEARRNFFVEAAAGMLGLVLGVFPFLSGALVFLDPLLRRKPAGKTSGGGSAKLVRVATLESLPVGTPVRVPIIANLVDAWNVEPSQPIGAVYLRRLEDGSVQCFNAICPHAGCFVAFNEGVREFQCPCHTSAFDIDGAKLDRPGKTNPSPRPMDRLTTSVKDGDVWVEFLNFYPGKHEKEAKA